MSDSVRPHRRQPTRLSRPWDSLGTLEWVAISFSNACMKVKSESEVAQSDSWRPHGRQPTRLLGPWDFPGRTLEWGAIAFSRKVMRWAKFIWIFVFSPSQLYIKLDT